MVSPDWRCCLAQSHLRILKNDRGGEPYFPDPFIFMITFIKTLQYETNPKDRDVFEYLSLLTLQKIDPPSTANACLSVNADTILHSPLRRVVDTLEQKQGTRYICLDALREIPFDLKQLCTKEEWRKEGNVIVRRRFKEAFIRDTLPIKRKQIFDEIKEVLCICKTYYSSHSIAIISHSFRLKIIEAFIATIGEIETNPRLIHNYLFDNRKMYEFGSGFTVRSITHIKF